MTRAMANSPAVLKGYLELSGFLATGTLPLAIRERLALALAVAEQNSCSYCLSAHIYLARNAAKLDAADIEVARCAESTEPRADVALKLAAAVTASHGDLAAADLAAARAGGLDDAQIAEVLAHIALNILTNYFTKAVEVALDFPVVCARTPPRDRRPPIHRKEGLLCHRYSCSPPSFHVASPGRAFPQP